MILGGRFGLLGVVLGGILGHFVEQMVRGGTGATSRYAAQGRAARARVFCRTAAAMLAKMAKADGRVSRDEIESVERAFRRLGFSKAARDYAVEAFRRAKDDARSIYAYAADFTEVVVSREARELFYGMLWDIACADGVVSSGEDAILRSIPGYLGISPEWYSVYARERYARSSSRRRRPEYAPPRDKLEEAYSILGVASGASDDEVRKAYRAKAKKYHPDTLRAQGLPDEMVGKATEQMARVNAAWSEIKSARGL